MLTLRVHLSFLLLMVGVSLLLLVVVVAVVVVVALAFERPKGFTKFVTRTAFRSHPGKKFNEITWA